MTRRTLIITVFVIVTLACAASPALAYAPYLAYPVDGAARLVPGASEAVYMWSEPGTGSTTRLMASRVQLSSGTAEGPYEVVSGIGGLDGWYASGDGLDVTVLWRDGDSVFVKQVELSGGATVYGPVLVSSDALAVTLRGVGAKAVPAGVAADGDGGAYLWCSLSPATSLPGSGDTLFNHVSAAGLLAVDAPGAPVLSGTVAALDTDAGGHAIALLGAPGRGRVAVRRYAPDLTAEWTRSPYLIDPPTVASSEPIGLIAGSTSTAVWREGGKVKVQRFSATGSRLALSPPSVTMSGAVKIASDGSSGIYLAGASGARLVARHILSSGREVPWGASYLSGLALAQPRVDAVTSNGAGDLFVSYSDAAGPSTATSGVALTTFLGPWTDITPATFRSALYPGAAPDGAGGAYVMGSGADARMWHMSHAAAALTFRPQAKLVQYGRSVPVAGYMTTGGGLPVSGGSVTVGRANGASVTPVTTAQTDAHGFYRTTISPSANAVWTATGVAVGGQAVIRVMPRVTLALAHITSGTRLTEIFTGRVAPTHDGRPMLVQKAAGSGWRTVASGRLDSRSRYRISWRLPYRTATYKLRVVLPAHADHAQGTSTLATLRVVIK